MCDAQRNLADGGDFPFLSAGMFVGKAGRVLKMMDRVVEISQQLGETLDQPLFQMAQIFNPELNIRVDSQAKFFRPAFSMNRTIEENAGRFFANFKDEQDMDLAKRCGVEEILALKSRDKMPYFLHFHGGLPRKHWESMDRGTLSKRECQLLWFETFWGGEKE